MSSIFTLFVYILGILSLLMYGIPKIISLIIGKLTEDQSHWNDGIIIIMKNRCPVEYGVEGDKNENPA